MYPDLYEKDGIEKVKFFLYHDHILNGECKQTKGTKPLWIIMD